MEQQEQHSEKQPAKKRGRPFGKDNPGNVAGRPKGTPNKVTRTIQEALMQSFDELDGVEYLKNLAKSSPQAYAGLLGKMLPKDINMTATVEHGIRNLSDAELQDKIEQMAKRLGIRKPDEWQ